MNISSIDFILYFMLMCFYYSSNKLKVENLEKEKLKYTILIVPDTYKKRVISDITDILIEYSFFQNSIFKALSKKLTCFKIEEDFVQSGKIYFKFPNLFPFLKPFLFFSEENDKKEIYKRYKDFELQKIDVKSKKDPDSYIEFKKNEINDKFLNQIEKKLSNFGGSKLGILLFNSEELIWYRKYKLLYIIENILIKRYIRGQEIHIYPIFNNDIF